jgi:hypothetical protein
MNVPDEILLCIVQYLNYNDLFSFSLVNQKYNSLSNNISELYSRCISANYNQYCKENIEMLVKISKKLYPDKSLAIILKSLCTKINSAPGLYGIRSNVNNSVIVKEKVLIQKVNEELLLKSNYPINNKQDIFYYEVKVTQAKIKCFGLGFCGIFLN